MCVAGLINAQTAEGPPNASAIETSRNPVLPPGDVFLLKRVPVTSSTGVVAMNAGTEVHVLERSGDQLTVEAGNVRFKVSKFDVTRNVKTALQFAEPEQKREIMERLRRQQASGKNAAWAKAQHIVLQSVEFRNAQLREIIDYLNGQSGAAAPNGDGVTVALELPESVQGNAEPLPPLPPITVSLRNVTLLQAVRAVSREANLQVRSEPYGLVIYR
jgi:hypothetical protein